MNERRQPDGQILWQQRRAKKASKDDSDIIRPALVIRCTARRGDYRVLFILDVEDHTLYVHRIEPL